MINSSQSSLDLLPDTYRFSFKTWRQSFLQRILRISLIVGALFLLVSFLTATAPILLVIYSCAYILLIISSILRLPHQLKATFYLAVILALGISGLFENGLRGDARVWLIIFSILATLLLGSKIGLIANGINATTLIVFGWLILSSRIVILNSKMDLGTIDAWVMATLQNIGLVALISAGISRLENDFQRAQATATTALETLQQERVGLDALIAERTKDLERRTLQLQAAADIGSTASRIRNVDLLLRQITRLISLRFGYYHVGIFLLDPRNEFAVLLASNSEGGQKMLARGHKLKVGQTGIVGFVTGHKQPRIALDVGQDAVFFDNPDLPETRSEIALPLLVGGKILGALDVQSKQPSAFSQEDAITLSVLADQIAIALENARLFEESQQTLETARRAFGYITGKAWEKLLQGQDIVGFTGLSDETIIQTTENIGSEALKAIDTGTTIQSEDNANLYIPIKIRENTIGVIRLDRSKSRQSWPEEDIATANLIAEQLGIALESARLYEEISQKAERETLISNTANRISSSIEFDRIMQATVEEIGHIFEDSEVVLQLKQKNND
jgi:GAF domain-containing protein